MSRDVIRTAIRERRLLVFRYRGFRRVVAPLAIGIGRKGSWQLRAQQVGGESASGRVADGTPKLFDLALVRDAALTSTAFALPAGYDREDEAFTTIDTALGDATRTPSDATRAPSADTSAPSAGHA